ALTKARQCDPPAPWWTVAWFNGLVNMENVNFEEAIEHFEQILDPKNRDSIRKLDFSKDWVVINELGKALFTLAQREEVGDRQLRDAHLRRAVEQFERTLQFDPENVTAHEFLYKCYARLAGGD